jgi:hypothetical protein
VDRQNGNGGEYHGAPARLAPCTKACSFPDAVKPPGLSIFKHDPDGLQILSR